MMGARAVRIIARTGLVAGSLLAGCAVVEVGLRLFSPQEIGLRWYTREGVMVYVPGLRGTYVRPEFRTPVAIDSDGLRDRDYPPGKAEGVYRILVLGDSLTAGLQVPAEETFCKRVETDLGIGRADRRIEVVNAGISGYGTADELRYLETYGARWRPDVVLVAFYCGNDVKNNMTERGLVHENGRIEVRAVPLTEWQYVVKGARSWLASHSHFYQFLRDRLKFDSGVSDLPPDAPGEGRRTAGRALDRFADWDLLFADPGPKYAAGWKLTFELLSRIDEVSRGLGARTAIVTIPSPWQTDPRSIPEHLEPAARGDTIDVLRPGRLVCAHASSIGVPCTDLLAGFQAAGADRSYYWKLDGHFTSKGHALAANLMTRFLEDESLVPKSRHP